MNQSEFDQSVQREIAEYIRMGERATQPPDCGEELEADMRARFIEEWDSQAPKMSAFLADRPELLTPIALAAIADDSMATGWSQQELIRAIDAVRESYIEWRRTRG